MIITASTVALQSQRAYAVHEQRQESLRVWRTPQQAAPAAAATPAPSGAAPATAAPATEEGSKLDDPRLALLEMLIEMLTGKPVHVFDASQLQSADGQAEPAAAAPPPATTSAAPPAAGYGVQYEFHAVRQETEQTSFSAQGLVRTADGREISFQLDLTMSRQQSEQLDIAFRAGDAQRQDPLVINFGGTAAQLLDTRFRFDLNADGQAENVPLLGGGSGYLALDLNGNGKIDSGAELFGPASGSGFQDLALYDQDGNGWIDENDAVFSRLKVWTPAQDGGGNLTGLAEMGVGALHLGNTATAFQLRGAGNSDLGAVRDSGVYLTEDGQVGSLQEVDLTV